MTVGREGGQARDGRAAQRDGVTQRDGKETGKETGSQTDGVYHQTS